MMEYKQAHQRAMGGSSVSDAAGVPQPGKRTLTERLAAQREEGAAEPEAAARRPGSSAPPAPMPSGAGVQMLFGVQRKATGPTADDSAHAAAAHGTTTPSTTLPYMDQIQRAFGGHDISKIRAHVGPEAAASARDMGARAYATGDHVVLGERPDLHTVAHEAAHVVQQRSGIHLKGGVGQVGDAHEQHADAVADRVVAGQSASDLLDQYTRPGGAASGGRVQMKAAPASTLPHPLPAAVTTVGYYAARNKDFQTRYPSAPPNPPSYYLGYGNKYAQRFTTVLLPKLSAKGQAWVWRTFTNLQLAMESKLLADKPAFDALEKDDGAFKKFAYGTHPKAYLKGGLHELPVTDLAKIAKTPDLGDLMTTDGIKQIFQTAVKLVPQWAGDAEHKAAHWIKSHVHF